MGVGLVRVRQVASAVMIGGLAVRNNLLCVTWSAGRGHVFLYDLEANERISSWTNPAGPSGYSDAGGIAIDRDFRIFVADAHNHCVRRYNAFGQHLGDLGLPMPASGDRAKDRTGLLDQPHAVAAHGERIYVAMGERPRQRAVQCFHVDGRVLPGLPAQGDGARKWGAPRGIFADDAGLLIADTLRGRIQRFRHDGMFVQEYLVCDGDARPGHLVRLPDGTMLMVDHSGVHATLHAMQLDGREHSVEKLNDACHDPLALAVGGCGRVYILDRGGERVIRANEDLSFDSVLFDLAEHDGDAPMHVD
ncbi:MAG: sugar lactone lactonase YvrE [Planctomycetota bacterium]|jgi:sugar lactone lactonase YvrE